MLRHYDNKSVSSLTLVHLYSKLSYTRTLRTCASVSSLTSAPAAAPVVATWELGDTGGCVAPDCGAAFALTIATDEGSGCSEAVTGFAGCGFGDTGGVLKSLVVGGCGFAWLSDGFRGFAGTLPVPHSSLSATGGKDCKVMLFASDIADWGCKRKF